LIQGKPLSALQFSQYLPRVPHGESMHVRVAIFAGTRPEAIKIAPLVRSLRLHRQLHTTIVSSGQHQVAVRDSLKEFGLVPDVELPQSPAAANLAAAADRLRRRLAAEIERHRPAVAVVQGDTLTTYAAALAARSLGCPVAHVEAGLRTSSPSDPFPEEWFRRRIARVAAWHFAPTRAAAENLLAEGVEPQSVHCTGNTGIDSLKWALDQAPRIERGGPVDGLLVTLHRRENYDRNAEIVCRSLVRLCELRPRLRVTFPVHANPRVAGPIRRRLGDHPSFELVPPMAYRDFIRAAARAALIVSDSGGIQEEAAHLGTPLLVPRCNTERPEALATGFVQLVRADERALTAAACAALDAPRRAPLPIDSAAPFGGGDAARRIAHVIAASIATRVYA
jgi:UDP-N-acetylglucosamine 2-epimerase (non-hydrolysing)